MTTVASLTYIVASWMRYLVFYEKLVLTSDTLQDSITLEDEKPRRPNVDENRRMRQPPPPAPRRRDGPPGPNHRPSQSQEEALRARKPQGGEPRRPPGGSSESPHKRPERRPRRNSDSSLLIDIEKPLTEEEKKARDARRRERERRHRPSRPNRKVDLIDQLDMTGIHGVGCKFQSCAASPLQFSAANVPKYIMEPLLKLTKLSTTTDPSTPATLTGTARAAAVLQ